ncbi:MAG: PilZ domain-containing protein [Planctomycetota bacterium]|nr:MAG: PilZ domain-containing protein [Planctomycetota bacterium]
MAVDTNLRRVHRFAGRFVVSASGTPASADRYRAGVSANREVGGARTAPRVPHRVPCRLRTIELAGAGLMALGETVNLSPEGLAVLVGQRIERGVRVEVLLPHLDGEPACFYGEVVRTRRVFSGAYEIGVSLNPPDRRTDGVAGDEGWVH